MSSIKNLKALVDMANKQASNVADSIKNLNQIKNSIKSDIPDKYADEFNELINISNKAKKGFDGSVDVNSLKDEIKIQENKINEKLKEDASKNR